MRPAPCGAVCPAGVDVRGFIDLVQKKKFRQACELIRQENPLSCITGRVCFHPCEDACNRGALDKAVSIRGLERIASEHLPDQEKKGAADGRGKRRSERIAVVGSGPAGLSCAYYLSRMGYRVHIYESRKRLGGMLRYGIPEFRLPRSVLDQEIKRILETGITYETGRHLGTDLKMEDLEKYDAGFFGIGAWSPLRFKAGHRALRTIPTGLEFLTDLHSNKTVSVKGRVAIIGGGNTAIDVARSVLRLGGEPLIVYRRSKKEMPASHEEMIEAEEEGVDFLFLTSVVDVHKDVDSKLKLRCMKNKLTKSMEGGRRIPVGIRGSDFDLKVDRVVYAIGQRVDASGLKRSLKWDQEEDILWVNGFCQTSRPWLFAGGDAAMNTRSVASAIGSAKKAAVAIDMYLNGKSDQEILRNFCLGTCGGISIARYLAGDRDLLLGESEVVRLEDINAQYFERQDRNLEDRLSLEKRRSGFREVTLGFKKGAAIEEAARCFSCGVCSCCDNCYIFCPEVAVTREADRNIINLDYCKGCGICANECPVGFIRMEPEVNE